MKVYLVTIACLLVFSCNVKKKEPNGMSKVELTRENSILPDTIENLKVSYTKKDYKMFFHFFPTSYKQFLDLYGFDELTGEKPLYNLYEEHINYLFEYDQYIRKEEFLEKIYEISLNAEWEADAPSILQNNITLFIMKYPEVISRFLSTKQKKDIESFWYFIFDGSTSDDLQNKEKYEIIYRKINTFNTFQAELIRRVFEKMYLKSNSD